MYRFRHALLREVVDDDLLPGEHSELHMALARALEHRPRPAPPPSGSPPGSPTTTASPGDQPAALRAGVRAAAAASGVHAHGEAAALLERALEIWDRVPDAEQLAGATHADVLIRAAVAHRSNGDDHRRSELLRRRCASSTRTSSPRVAEALGELASAEWSMGRGEASRSTLRQALALLPRDDHSAERAELLSRQVTFLMLQGRYNEVRDAAEEAIEAAAGRRPELSGPVLNRLGVSLFALGEEEEGRRPLDEALAVSRDAGERSTPRSSLSNLADALHRAGRSREGLQVAIDGAEACRRARAPRPGWACSARRSRPRSASWDEAERHIPMRGRLTGTTLANADILRLAAAGPRRHGRRPPAAGGGREPARAVAGAAVPRRVRIPARGARAPRGEREGRPRGRRGGDRPDRVLQRGRGAARRGGQGRRRGGGRRGRAGPRSRRHRGGAPAGCAPT